MQNNPFLNKEVNLKRITKGLIIGLPVVVMITVIGNYYINLIDDSLREKYQTEKIVYVDKENVLGEEVTELSDSEDFQTDYTKWLYNEADRIVINYDISDKEIKPLVQIPEISFLEDQDSVNKEYLLSTEDTISIECFKIDTTASEVYDISYCDVSLNGHNTEEITAWGWTDNKSIDAHITIFDNEKLEYPLIVVAEHFRSGSRDNLSVYRVDKNNLKNLKFNNNQELKDMWFSNPLSKLFIDNSGEFLVTYFHDPAMMEKSLTRVWEVQPMELYLKSTILERGGDWLCGD